jgi:tetratricopeptide (TPR) repeat protein
MKARTIIFIIASVLTSSIMVQGQTSASIAKGDYYFNLMRYKDAIAWYNLDSSKAEAQWKIAKAYVCHGDKSTTTDKEMHYKLAVTAAKRCIQIEETNSNGHTWLAAALGNTAMYEGSKTKVMLATQIKAELLRAIALNPNDDIAYSILGSFYREVANISWLEKKLALTFIGKIPDGTFQDSKNAFDKSIALNPTLMRNWYELGLLYIYWDKDAEAKTAFLKAQTCAVLIWSDYDRLADSAVQLKKLE